MRRRRGFSVATGIYLMIHLSTLVLLCVVGVSVWLPVRDGDGEVRLSCILRCSGVTDPMSTEVVLSRPHSSH